MPEMLLKDAEQALKKLIQLSIESIPEDILRRPQTPEEEERVAQYVQRYYNNRIVHRFLDELFDYSESQKGWIFPKGELSRVSNLIIASYLDDELFRMAEQGLCEISIDKDGNPLYFVKEGASDEIRDSEEKDW